MGTRSLWLYRGLLSIPGSVGRTPGGRWRCGRRRSNIRGGGSRWVLRHDPITACTRGPGAAIDSTCGMASALGDVLDARELMAAFPAGQGSLDMAAVGGGRLRAGDAIVLGSRERVGCADARCRQYGHCDAVCGRHKRGGGGRLSGNRPEKDGRAAHRVNSLLATVLCHRITQRRQYGRDCVALDRLVVADAAGRKAIQNL